MPTCAVSSAASATAVDHSAACSQLSTAQEDREKSIRDFCDIARRRGNVEWRSAVIEEDRKEFFRGKDLLRYCEKNPECLDGVCDPGTLLARLSCL